MAGKRRALAERREVVGHSQESVARFVGVEPTTVGRWERGETSPQPGVRRKLAEALKVSVEQLDTLLAEGQPPVEAKPSGGAPPHAVDVFDDRVLSAPWSHRGTVEAAVLLRGGDLVKRRVFGWLTGLALTAPAHQWLVHEPGPLVSALSGRRVPAGLLDRFTTMITELRRMDDVAGGGTVLSLAQQEFDLVAGLLDRAVYDERTGRALYILLGDLGQLAEWAAYDGGHHPLAQRYWITALRATHSADDRMLGAHILGDMAEQAARHGQPVEAVTLIDTAIAGTRGQHTPALL
ncbi:MAG TPA: helix-turn-helix transcriptional regulator, partial [Pseudonocardiaceae bacterium]|nr:helix-turn-helix transcriptional regulator [Pseudonocardiaceae bacterium]